MRKEIILKVRATDLAIKEIEHYLKELPTESLLSGLKFAYTRKGLSVIRKKK